jgi:hypothetical protein
VLRINPFEVDLTFAGLIVYSRNTGLHHVTSIRSRTLLRERVFAADYTIGRR